MPNIGRESQNMPNIGRESQNISLRVKKNKFQIFKHCRSIKSRKSKHSEYWSRKPNMPILVEKVQTFLCGVESTNFLKCRRKKIETY